MGREKDVYKRQPVEKSVLLLLETGMMEGEEPPSPQVKSAMAEAVVSVSQSLCEEKIRHQIAWQDQELSLIHI